MFAETNATKQNQSVRYKRAADGTLARLGTVSAHGLGICVDLDVQGPLRLSADHQHLYAVNAGSDDVSVFTVNGTNLNFQEKVYAGDEPVSLTIHDNLVYVLDGSVGVRPGRVSGCTSWTGQWVYVLDGSVASNGIRGFTATDATSPRSPTRSSR